MWCACWAIDSSKAQVLPEYGRREHYFCSLKCKGEFERNLSRYEKPTV
ncbi:MAG: YHS domain-containing protein [Methanomassiliicoccales archaeon]|nr:MAG: YHS domain-containing protein [Methanomassiliicoccales archaeon]